MCTEGSNRHEQVAWRNMALLGHNDLIKVVSNSWMINLVLKYIHGTRTPCLQMPSLDLGTKPSADRVLTTSLNIFST